MIWEIILSISPIIVVISISVYIWKTPSQSFTNVGVNQ